jgi:hypothetical protein
MQIIAIARPSFTKDPIKDQNRTQRAKQKVLQEDAMRPPATATDQKPPWYSKLPHVMNSILEPNPIILQLIIPFSRPKTPGI